MDQPADDSRFAALCNKIERDRGFYCTNYKDTCLRRRITARMRRKGAATFEEYSDILDRDTLEYDRLVATLTINVSKFFRNPEAYACIAAKVLPELWDGGGPIRIWSAGCALGEEPYSLGVICKQHEERHLTTHGRRTVQILGTDVDANAISAAQDGRYAPTSFVDTTPAVRDKYFPLAGGFHTANAEMQQLVSFERADLFDSSYQLPRLHLIVCRNVIIYFRRPAQEILLAQFRDLLLPGGFLVLGKVESLFGRSRDGFETVSARERIYRRL